MTGLREVVQAVARRPGVEAVVLTSPEGLTIDSATAHGADVEAIAALTATLTRQASDLGRGANRGSFKTGVLEYDGGLTVVAEVGSEGVLVILVRSGTDIGELLFDLHRHRPAVAELL